ncbi:MAG TPA: VOC family protein [Gaiellaceae bacterium]|jgi:predicted enzyme related to lactoylglutathione lyase|nr:VOC family protein [Gaiellaceae bacterium]
MEVHGIVWLGIRTGDFGRLREFFEGVMKLSPAETADDFVRYQLPNRDQLELFGPAMETQGHFTTGPVPEFLVDDVHEAVAELEAAGIEILKPPTRWRDDYYSAHFRGPDGNVYGVLSGRYFD